MKYAIMSDAHANPAALERALADARRRGCRKFVFLGDATGYGYDAKRTLDLVWKCFNVVLMGNHDSACRGLEPRLEVELNRNYDLDRAQRSQVTEADAERLKALPYIHVDGDAAFVHGDFLNPRGWGYIFDEWDARENLSNRSERLLFCGHTHHAAIWEEADGTLAPLFEKRLDTPALKAESLSFPLRRGRRYLVNVGSVGYPRNDYCATYAIYDSSAGRIALRRLPFDFSGYVSEMTRRGIQLPIWLRDLLVRSIKA